MEKIYKGYLEMQDGTKLNTSFFRDKEKVLQIIKGILSSTTRYFKKDGVDYGQMGKLFTFEEEHNGLKNARIVEFTDTCVTEIDRL